MAKRITDEQMNVKISINGGDPAQKKLGDLENSYRGLNQKAEDLRKAKQKLIAEGKKESQAYEDVKNALAQTNAEIKENRSAQSQMRKEIGLTGLTMRDLKKEQRSLMAQIDSATTKGTDDYEELKKELQEVNKVIKEQRDDLRGTQDEMEKVAGAADQLTAATSDIFMGLRSGNIAQAGAGLTALRGQLTALTAQAWAFITTPLGLALAGIAGILAGFKWFHDYNKGAHEAMLLTEQLTGLQGAQADQARTQAKAMEATYGSDFQETLKAAKVLSKEFGITFQEALDTIEDGLIRGGKANDEYFDSFREYSTFFAQAGFSAEEFKNIINTGFNLGIYTDKLPDALKEADLSLKEQTKSTRDALVNAFGASFSDEILSKVKSGEMTTKDALKSIAAESKRVNIDQQQNGQLTADIFRGAGEEAGKALKIFEAVNKSYEEQNRALTPLEEQLKDVADANKELEAAQDSALKSDKYIAFTNDIEVAWIKFKTGFFDGLNGVLTGLLNADTAFRKFVYQSVQYVKTAFSLEDADWDAIGKKFDQMEEKKRKAAEQERKRQKQNQNGSGGSVSGNENNQAEIEAAAAAAKKRYEKLRELEEEYEKQKQDRLAESHQAKAELERDRAIQEAEQLGAKQALLDKINAEHKEKIAQARTQDEEEELARMQEFEARRQALKDEIALMNAENDEARDLLAAEQKYERDQEKLERDLEQLQLTEIQKNELRLLLEEQYEAEKTAIQAEHMAIRAEQDQKFKAEQIKRDEDLKNRLADAAEQLEDAKENAQQRGLRVLMGFFDKKSGIYKALFILEKGAAMAQVVNQGAKSLAEITANTAAANAKAVSASPLTAGMPWVAVNTAIGLKEAASVKLNTALQVATIGASAIKGVTGYEDGFYGDYVDATRTDGRRFKAKRGTPGTQLISQPTYFREYLGGENGMEMMIDNGTLKRLNPDTVHEILSTARSVSGYETGYYKSASAGGSSSAGMDPEFKMMMGAMLNYLQNPPRPVLPIGYAEIQKFKDLENDLNDSTNNGKLNS